MAMPRRKKLKEISFWYYGQVPSKSNFRRAGKDWRERWSRIKQFEKDIKKLATEAGGKTMPRGSEVELYYEMYNQLIDCSNGDKGLADALEGICYEKDKVVTKGGYQCFKDKQGPRMYVRVRIRD